MDPVVLFKMVLIQHIYGLPSLRRTAEEVGMNIAYRWFVGYMINEATPHFSTVSYNFKHRYREETVERIFRWILSEIANAGYLSVPLFRQPVIRSGELCSPDRTVINRRTAAF